MGKIHNHSGQLKPLQTTGRTSQQGEKHWYWIMLWQLVQTWKLCFPDPHFLHHCGLQVSNKETCRKARAMHQIFLLGVSTIRHGDGDGEMPLHVPVSSNSPLLWFPLIFRLITLLSNSITRPITRCSVVNWQKVANDQPWRWINGEDPEYHRGCIYHSMYLIQKTSLPLAPCKTDRSLHHQVNDSILSSVSAWNLCWHNKFCVPFLIERGSMCINLSLTAGGFLGIPQTIWSLKTLQQDSTLNSCRVHLLPSEIHVY